MKTKTVTVTVQIQLDIEDNGNDVQNVIETLSNMNDSFVNMFPETSPCIFANSIDHSDILGHDNEAEDIYPITAEDVEQVAIGLSILMTDELVQQVLELYPSEQESDPTATWNLVVEKIIYDITD